MALLTPYRVWFPILVILSVYLTVFLLIQIKYLSSYSNYNNRTARRRDFQNHMSYMKKTPFGGEILIHFDFKGAPPKVSYLMQIIPLIKKFGATGVLLEYEDMFPYHGDLEDIKALNAYSPSDVAKIVGTAEAHNLTVIPLVQTFGHLGFLLKLEKYRRFREVDQQPDVLCPSKSEVYPVLHKMIDQVLEAHPNSKYFHIGCDETFVIGICPKCNALIRNNKLRKDDLYFRHVKKIAEYIIKAHPGVRPMLWGDKFRRNERTILKYDIPKLLDVMFWNFAIEKHTFPKIDDVKSFARLFQGIWIAGSYKGSTGSTQIITNPEIHVKNTKAWLEFVSRWKDKINFKGVALTGWQRYTHFTVLCDLLPVAIPSLALTLRHWSSSKDFDDAQVRHLLNCNDSVPTDLKGIQNAAHISSLNCQFPGFRIYQIIHLYYNEIQTSGHLAKGFQSGDVSFYNIINNISSPLYVEYLNKKDYRKRLSRINKLEAKIRNAMAEIYDEYTVAEWTMTHVMPVQLRLEAEVNILNTLTKKRVWPRRPLPHDAASLRHFFKQICGPTEIRGCALFDIH